MSTNQKRAHSHAHTRDTHAHAHAHTHAHNTKNTFIALQDSCIKERCVHHCPIAILVNSLAGSAVERLELDGAVAMDVSLAVVYVAVNERSKSAKRIFVLVCSTDMSACAPACRRVCRRALCSGVNIPSLDLPEELHSQEHGSILGETCL